MSAANANQGKTIADLAAGLTDLALESLAGASLLRNSIEVELRLWHALQTELERDRRRLRSISRPGETGWVRDAWQIVNRAAQRVADALEPVLAQNGRRAESADRRLCLA